MALFKSGSPRKRRAVGARPSWSATHVRRGDDNDMIIELDVADPSTVPGGDPDRALAAAVRAMTPELLLARAYDFAVSIAVHPSIVLHDTIEAVAEYVSDAQNTRTGGVGATVTLGATVDPPAFEKLARVPHKRGAAIGLKEPLSWVTDRVMQLLTRWPEIYVHAQLPSHIGVRGVAGLILDCPPGRHVSVQLPDEPMAEVVDAMFCSDVALEVVGHPPRDFMRAYIERRITDSNMRTVYPYVQEGGEEWTFEALHRAAAEARRERVTALVADQLPVVGVPEIVAAFERSSISP